MRRLEPAHGGGRSPRQRGGQCAGSKPGNSAVASDYCENLPAQYIGERMIGNRSRAALAAIGVAEPLRIS